jgi:ribosomal protein S6--L-glutamate ligase
MSKLLIISTEKENWAVKQLVEKAETAGFEVEILNPNKSLLTLGENPKIYSDNNEFIGADICLPRLSEENLEYKTALLKHIESIGIKVINTSEAMYKASNKIESHILLSKVGIKTPRAVLITNEDQLDSAVLLLNEKFPMIIKTITGTHGCGVIISDSKPSLKSMVSLLLKEEVKFMLQEYIEHSESARILMLAGKPLASVMRTVPENDFRSNAHLGSVLKAYEPSEAEIEACKKSCEALNINFAAVDYIVSGDDILILEVNGSPGFESMQEVLPDFNIAEAIIAHCSSVIDEPSKVETDGININVTGDNDQVEVETDDKSEIAPIEEPENQEPNIVAVKDPETGEISIELANQEETTEEPEVVDIDREDSQELDDLITSLSDEKPEENKVIGTTVKVIINHFDSEIEQDARVDTGAKLCSINGSDIEVNEESRYVKFRYDDAVYKFHLFRMIKIKQVADGSNPIRRPVIQLDIIINGIVVRNAECTINDRDHMKYSILLGRQVLAAAGVLVDPSVDSTSSEEE